MTEEEYRNRTPLSDTCWTQCGTKFSCNGDCPNKGERVDMETKELAEKLKNEISPPSIIFPYEKRDCQHLEETSFGKKSKLMIVWDDDLSEGDIDWLQSFVNLQIKKMRRMCKVTE